MSAPLFKIKEVKKVKAIEKIHAAKASIEKITDFKDVQFANIRAPTRTTVSGLVIETRPLSSKAEV